MNISSNEFEIKLEQKEKVKGPLPKVTETGSSASRFNFFFALPNPYRFTPEGKELVSTATLHQQK